MLHEGEVPVVMYKHDHLKVADVAIHWVGDDVKGFVHVTAISTTCTT